MSDVTALFQGVVALAPMQRRKVDVCCVCVLQMPHVQMRLFSRVSPSPATWLRSLFADVNSRHTFPSVHGDAHGIEWDCKWTSAFSFSVEAGFVSLAVWCRAATTGSTTVAVLQGMLRILLLSSTVRACLLHWLSICRMVLLVATN
jgi:hypothetical protein